MTEAINQSRNNSDWVNQINNVHLSARRKTELLIELAAKKRTIVNGGLFMQNHKTVDFDDYDHALELLDRAKTAYDLGAVETALQSQIESILRMADGVDLTVEEKSLCLYALQDMIFGLSDHELPHERVNDYTPKILQDHAQVILKGTSKGMDWNYLNDYCYTEKYQDPSNPVLSQFKFLDLNLIKELDKIVTQKNTTVATQRVHEAPNAIQCKNGMITWDILEFEKNSQVNVDKILNDARAKFDAIDLRNHVSDLFNFVKDSVKKQNQKPEAINHQVLYEITVAAMYRIVEIGSERQRVASQQSSMDEGRTM